jgi:hypothetical protein
MKLAPDGGDPGSLVVAVDGARPRRRQKAKKKARDGVGLHGGRQERDIAQKDSERAAADLPDMRHRRRCKGEWTAKDASTTPNDKA